MEVGYWLTRLVPPWARRVLVLRVFREVPGLLASQAVLVLPESRAVPGLLASRAVLVLPVFRAVLEAPSLPLDLAVLPHRP